MPDLTNSNINETDKKSLVKCLDDAMAILKRYPRKTYVDDGEKIYAIDAIRCYVEDARKYCSYLNTD